MTRVVNISESITLDLAAAELWNFVQDYTNDTTWRTGLSVMTPTPPGLPQPGTTVHEVVSKLGSTYVTHSIVTDIGPGYRYRFAGDGDAGRIHGGRSVTDAPDGGATFVYEIDLHLDGVRAALAPMIRTAVVRGLRRDLRSLRSVLASRYGRAV